MLLLTVSIPPREKRSIQRVPEMKLNSNEVTIKQVLFIAALGILHHKCSTDLVDFQRLYTIKSYIFTGFLRNHLHKHEISWNLLTYANVQSACAVISRGGLQVVFGGLQMKARSLLHCVR